MAKRLEFLLVVIIAVLALMSLAFFVKAYFADSLVGKAMFAEQKQCVCENFYEPVCGSDYNSYMNDCVAECSGAEVLYRGLCS